MSRNQTILAIVAAAVVAWGCGKTQTGQPASLSSPQQTKSLEAKVAKLEQELRATQAQVGDQEAKLKAEQARSQNLEKERDSLRAELKARTTERDSVQAQFDGFRKSLKDLLGQMEAAAAPKVEPTAPTVTVPPVPASVNAIAPVKAPF